MLSPPSLLHPPGKEVQRPVAHECLGEVLRVLRQVISTYPLLNTVEILTAAGKLISRVKGAYHSAVSYRCLKKKKQLDLQEKSREPFISLRYPKVVLNKPAWQLNFKCKFLNSSGNLPFEKSLIQLVDD